MVMIINRIKYLHILSLFASMMVPVVWGQETVTDINGNVYQTIQIGEQLWMAENLKVTHYNNGDSISTGYSNSEWADLDETETGAYAIYNDDPSNAETYGNIYNWYSVDDGRGTCPEDWHIPTDEEIKELEVYLGMSESEANSWGWRGTNEGGKRKEAGTEHWASPNTGATNESGFTAFPGGSRFYNDGIYQNMGGLGYFWFSSEDDSNYAWSRLLSYNFSGIHRGSYNKRSGFSVRCMRDETETGTIEFPKNIIGYYTSWSVYARDYHVPDIPGEMINFINYAFANINPSTGTIMLGDPYADIDKFYPGDCWEEECLRGSFHQLQLLKAENPHVKTLISVGGWTWSTYFSDVAMTEESREIFAQSCVDFILEYDFDGIDLDWEYPVEGGLGENHHDPDDGIHLTLLLQSIRQMLDEQEAITGRTYYLTIAASANPIMMDHLESEAISEILDWINIMSYDFHGPWSGEGDPVTNFNSPLYSVEEDPTPEPYHSEFNLSSSIQNYIERGVPKDKLNAGLAFYGRAFGGVISGENGLYASYSGPAGDGTWENGVFDYWDLDTDYIDMNGYSKYWHDEAKVPWLFNPSTQIMVSYDDEESILLKAQLINDEDIGGAMFWEFSGDKNVDLLNVVHEIIMSGDSSESEGVHVSYFEDWNLVSVPNESDNFPCTNYIEGTLYSFEGNSYTNVEMAEIIVGHGYWLRFEDAVECIFSGSPITETTVQLTAGWNLIGSISSLIDVNSIIDEEDIIIPGTVFSFTPTGYLNAEILEPGKGYWIRTNNSGIIVLMGN